MSPNPETLDDGIERDEDGLILINETGYDGVLIDSQNNFYNEEGEPVEYESLPDKFRGDIETNFLATVVESFFEGLDRIVVKNSSREILFKSKDQQQTINLNGADLVDITNIAYDLFNEWNGNEPHLFADCQGRIVQVRLNDSGTHLVISPVDKHELRYFLIRLARFIVINSNGEVKNKVPSNDILMDMLAVPKKELPMLDRIFPHPYFGPDGTMHNFPGYNPKTKSILDLQEGLILYNVEKNPSKETIDIAKAVVRYGLFSGAKFETKSDRANAYALFLLFFVRDMINGPTPMHVFESSDFGAGKTLLAESIVQALTGSPIKETTFPTNESEVKKQILAHLLQHPQYIFFDNLSHDCRLASAELAQMLTGLRKSGRILGQSKMVDFSLNLIWMLSGVNMNISKEILRRCIRIRIKKAEWHPHPDHLGWIAENRSKIIWAGLTIVQTWIVAGSPKAKISFRSYEKWGQIMGGILDVIKVEGLIENQQEFNSSGDPEYDGYLALVDAWWNHFAESKVMSRELLDLVDENEIPLLIPGRGGSNRAMHLGFLLKKLKDREIGGFILKNAGLITGRRTWHLIQKQ